MPDEINFSIRYNSIESSSPCQLCGRPAYADVGPELFLEDTRALVCYECARKHAPNLHECLTLYRNTLPVKEDARYISLIQETCAKEVSEWLGELRASERGNADPPDV